jgi:hypothetical protein
MSPQVNKNKGTILKGYSTFIKKKWGKEGLSDCEKAVGMELSNILDDKWYPQQHTIDLLEWIKDTHGLDFCRQAGYSTVAERGLISFAARILGIEKVLERGKKDFQEAIGYGDVKIQILDKKALVTITGVNQSEPDCQTWLGALQGILFITKTKGSVKKTHCQVKGDTGCVYEMEWS